MKSKSNPDFLKKDRSCVTRQLRNIRSKVSEVQLVDEVVLEDAGEIKLSADTSPLVCSHNASRSMSMFHVIRTSQGQGFKKQDTKRSLSHTNLEPHRRWGKSDLLTPLYVCPLHIPVITLTLPALGKGSVLSGGRVGGWAERAWPACCIRTDRVCVLFLLSPLTVRN